MIRTAGRQPHRRKIRLFNLDFRLRFHGRRRADEEETLRKTADYVGQRLIAVRLDGRLDFGRRLLLRAFLIAQFPLRPGARRDIDIVTDDGISGLAALAHFDLGVRAVADIPIPKIRLRRRVNRHIAGVFPGFSFRRYRRIIHIDACDAHRRAHRRHFDIARFGIVGRRIDVRILNDEIAAFLRLLRIRPHLPFRRSHRQRDIPAAGFDRRVGDREILLRLGRDRQTVGGERPLRRDISRRRERNPAARDRRHRR